MKSTGMWAKVADQDGQGIGIRMLHEDRRGRLCVRYGRQWWLVDEKSILTGAAYQIRELA